MTSGNVDYMPQDDLLLFRGFLILFCNGSSPSKRTLWLKQPVASKAFVQQHVDVSASFWRGLPWSCPWRVVYRLILSVAPTCTVPRVRLQTESKVRGAGPDDGRAGLYTVRARVVGRAVAAWAVIQRPSEVEGMLYIRAQKAT